MCSNHIAIACKIPEFHRKILIIQHDIHLHEYTDPACSHTTDRINSNFAVRVHHWLTLAEFPGHFQTIRLIQSE